jgi:membrane carboxypeptidase/penicillin-binding protein
LRTTIKLPIKPEWEKLRNEVIQIQVKLESEIGPIPTIQMCDLLIAGEDHRFRFHPGFDLIGLMRAIWRTLIPNLT